MSGRGLSRDRIESYLWPESSAPRARHALDQLLYAIRQALGSDSILSTARELRLNPGLFRADVWEFDEAIQAGRWAEAVGHYKGPLLEGIHFADSRELESWIDAERARLHQDYQSAIERLAKLSGDAGDHAQGVVWLRKLANSDPLSAGPTKKLILALAAAGDRAGAVKQARLYQELVRRDLEIEPDSEIEDLVSSLSHPGSNGGAGTTARKPAAVAPIAVSPAPETRVQLPRTKRARLVALSSFAVLVVLLIGVVAVAKRGWGRASSLAEITGRGSRIVALAARDSYLRGLDAWGDGAKAGLDSAVVYFRRATELDPEYAEAYAGLADAYVMLGYFGYRPREEVFPKAKDAALRSMQLDNTLASAHPALAYELTWERDFVGANSEFRKATALDPTYASARTRALDPTYAKAHQWYAILLMILAEKPGAVDASQPTAKPDPFSLNVPVIEVTFTKWMTDYPMMAGSTSNGPETMTGQVLSRIDDGAFTHMVARYEVTDPKGTHSFKAVIQGKADNKTGKYDLSGIVTWGWMMGAHVRVLFQRITPCQFGKLGVCFQGTIQIQRS